ncbi:MAG: 2Fe-2S iron-sulfur cluster binding domain-containing protein [Phycisphaerales bacterium]|nr:2Fe-2S iron-sulfur cluster binding domain-containing protein [Phycisphaerales bacterium]
MSAHTVARPTTPRLVAAILALLLGSSMLYAQVSPEEHAKHHPQAGAQQPGSGTSGTPGGIAGMESMMEGMLRAPPKELYPRLMELPSLTSEQREELQRAAHERMESGTKMMGEAMDVLLTRAGLNDYAAMQDALNRLREGAARFDSGLSTHRAIAEGKSPQQVGLQWFKSQLNLPEPQTHEAGGWLGWSLGHWVIMVLLAGFGLAVIGMYFVKMRRASSLLRRLTEPPPGAVVAPASTAVTATVVPPTPLRLASAAEPAELRGAAIGPWSGSLRVSNVFLETPAIKTLRLVNPAGGSIPFSFVPGQFLTLAVALAGKTTKRSYTIASSAAQRDYVEVTVKREDQGVVSRYLHDRVAPGDLLQISAPQGRFTFAGTEAESIVLIGAGVGITPLMCIIRTLTDRGWNKDMFLLFACRSSEDFVFRDELERLQKRHANLHVVATMTRSDGTVWMGPKGRLTKDLIAQSVPDLPNRRIHVCGPPAMMDATRVMLADLGVKPSQVFTEAFGPAEKKEVRLSAVQTAMVEAPPETTPVVSFSISQKAAPLPPDTSVLEAAEHVGVSIDNSCRAGTCGLCKVRLLKGSVTMAVEDGLSPEEKSKGIILACQAKSKTNIEVEA